MLFAFAQRFQILSRIAVVHAHGSRCLLSFYLDVKTRNVVVQRMRVKDHAVAVGLIISVLGARQCFLGLTSFELLIRVLSLLRRSCGAGLGEGIHCCVVV